MLTHVHEDIYVYVDKIEEQTQTLSGSTTFSLSNNATNSAVDPGIITVDVDTNTYSLLEVTCGLNTLTINLPLSVGDVLTLNLRDKVYKLNGSIILLDNYLELSDNANNTINLSFTGTGTATVSYVRGLPIVNNNDLFFCTGLDRTKNTEIFKKNNLKGDLKLIKTAKKDYQWSINGLCNDTELAKFESGTGFFRLRLIDEEGNGLENLAHCVISSFQKSSSDTGDYTYNLNGSFKNIF